MAESVDTIWGLKDYALFVPMSDRFYATLPFKRITEEQFRFGSYDHQPVYKDSRTYMRPILRHFDTRFGQPYIFDVGGYIGRFSIESGLLCDELSLDSPIYCFEPGDTYDMLARNLNLNGYAQRVRLMRFAVSDRHGEGSFGVPSDAKITSRIIADSVDLESQFGSRWSRRQVELRSLGEFLPADREELSFVCKIDTEGHEAEVMRGIGEQALAEVPHALVIEFWPILREKQIFGVPFEDYLLDNYIVFNIRSSLYPAGYQLLTGLDDVCRQISSGEINNVDFLLIRKSTVDVEALVAEIEVLAT